MHSLFLQLQSRYPTSSLLTELVQVHKGMFIVRALVQVGGTAIAAGMASAASVEQAEDQARIRVLSLLGIVADFAEPTLVQPAVASNGSGTTTLATTPEQSWLHSTPQENPSSTSPIPSLPVNFATPKELIDDAPTFNSFNTQVDEPTLPNYLETSLDAPSAESNPVASDPVEPVAHPAKPSLPPKPQKVATKIENMPITQVPEADDLSSLIALTDVEMDRIGWTKQEGRDYLKRTYGKSTRQRLDEDELLDFLNYLRALPSLNGL